MTWDISTPAGSEAANNGDNRIRELKVDLQTALRGNDTDGNVAKFPGTDTANPVYHYRGGKGSEGARPAAGDNGLYTNTSVGHLQRDNGTSWENIATLIPAGIVCPYAGASAPSGWLLCDGSAVSRTTYADLFAAIGVAHGVGDGATTFNIPNYQGRFLRGVDGSAGNDPDKNSRTAMATGGNTGNNVGSVQDDATAIPTNTPFTTSDPGDHNHNDGNYSRLLQATDTNTVQNVDNSAGEPNLTSYGTLQADGSHTHTIGGGDNETRPVNAYVNYLIKT